MDCSRLMVEFWLIWEARHSYRLFCNIRSFSGPEIAVDEENSRSHCPSRLHKPKPPNRADKANMFLSVSLDGGLPVTVGMKTVRMMFSRG